MRKKRGSVENKNLDVKLTEGVESDKKVTIKENSNSHFKCGNQLEDASIAREDSKNDEVKKEKHIHPTAQAEEESTNLLIVTNEPSKVFHSSTADKRKGVRQLKMN
ncbi:hypothetical protein L6452_19686 [Arctium lappa]|uniref:Uncharacterized protein n=1 Tax=Arctium lappa TaxID=4217 RepID=A0ACB9B8S1_ARCLA|nr:hypothetical protein L6452_19686 [Arctium lappa]